MLSVHGAMFVHAVQHHAHHAEAQAKNVDCGQAIAVDVVGQQQADPFLEKEDLV